MLVAFIFCILSGSALALDDEVRQLIAGSQLRSPGIGQVPVQFYKRDDQGTEKVLTINPVYVEREQPTLNIVPLVRNNNDLNTVVPISIPQDTPTYTDNDTNKLTHLLTVVRDCLEKHRAMHAREGNTKATISVQYDIPTSNCPHTLSTLDLLKLAYKDQHSNNPVVIPKSEVAPNTLKSCQQPIIHYHQPTYLENVLGLRVKRPFQLRDNDQQSVINQFVNSENSYNVYHSKNKNRETTQTMLNLLLNSIKANAPTTPVSEETVTSNENILSLLNTILAKNNNYNDIRPKPYYDNQLQNNLNDLIGSSSAQSPAFNFYTNPFSNVVRSENRYRSFPSVLPIGQNANDNVGINSPVSVDNPKNSLQKNQINVHNDLKVLHKPRVQLDSQNTYGLYQQLKNQNTLGFNQANVRQPQMLRLPSYGRVTPITMPVVVDKKNELTDLSQLLQLGRSNPLKLNHVPNNSGVVELTYVIRQAKEAHQPLYYVKYRLPSQQFYNNLQNVLEQKIHLRSGSQDLNEELLTGSNVTEVTGDLKRLNDDEITRITSNKGTLVTARVLENNEAVADDQVRMIKEINSKLSLLNTDISNGGDRQRLLAVQRLINATRSNVLGGNVRSYYDPMSAYTLMNPQRQFANYYRNQNPYKTQNPYQNLYG